MKFQKILSLLTVCVMLLTVFTSCAKDTAPVYTDTVFTGMDTVITLRLARAGVDGAALSAAVKQCREIVAELENKLSCHNDTGALAAWNKNVNLTLQPDETLLSVWEMACTMHTLTQGAYDPTLGVLTDLWNIRGGGPVPDALAIREALSHTGTDKLIIGENSVAKADPALQVDLGGIGKGYALQELLTYLDSTDIAYGLVSLGGNIGVFGQKPDAAPYQIGIKNPENTDTILGYLYIQSGFVSVSGDYERFFEEDGVVYHHILDPQTGYPADTGLSSVVCFAQNGAAADALSTALYVMGLEEGMALYENSDLRFEAIFITDAHQIHLTPGLAEKELFQLTAPAYTLAGQ